MKNEGHQNKVENNYLAEATGNFAILLPKGLKEKAMDGRGKGYDKVENE